MDDGGGHHDLLIDKTRIRVYAGLHGPPFHATGRDAGCVTGTGMQGLSSRRGWDTLRVCSAVSRPVGRMAPLVLLGAETRRAAFSLSRAPVPNYVARYRLIMYVIRMMDAKDRYSTEQSPEAEAATRAGRIAPRRPLKIQICLTPDERVRLNEQARAAGYDTVSAFVGRCIQPDGREHG
jgi:hypothetical protein